MASVAIVTMAGYPIVFHAWLEIRMRGHPVERMRVLDPIRIEPGGHVAARWTFEEGLGSLDNAARRNPNDRREGNRTLYRAEAGTEREHAVRFEPGRSPTLR